jgi:hypothetical protein
MHIVPVTDALQVSGDSTANAGSNSEDSGENLNQNGAQTRNLETGQNITECQADSPARRYFLDLQPRSAPTVAPGPGRSLPATPPSTADSVGGHPRAPAARTGERGVSTSSHVHHDGSNDGPTSPAYSGSSSPWNLRQPLLARHLYKKMKQKMSMQKMPTHKMTMRNSMLIQIQMLMTFLLLVLLQTQTPAEILHLNHRDLVLGFKEVSANLVDILMELFGMACFLQQVNLIV